MVSERVCLEDISVTFLKAGMGIFIAYSGCPARSVKGLKVWNMYRKC